MAEIVGTFGVPHTPAFPALVAEQGPQSEVARLFSAVREHLDAVQPDVIVLFDSDHLNTFFLDNLPTFCVGLAPATTGPNDEPGGMPVRTVRVDTGLARGLLTGGIKSGFDLASTQEFTVDHSVMVPLHFLTPDSSVPIVPIFINGLVPPLPLARRCFALGEAVAGIISAWPSNLRVAIVASGSFSLEVGGPRIDAGKVWGVPSPGWADTVLRHLREGQVDDLLNQATQDQLLHAGNVGGELLNWIATLGVVGGRRPVFLEAQREMGHAFAAWRWD